MHRRLEAVPAHHHLVCPECGSAFADREVVVVRESGSRNALAIAAIAFAAFVLATALWIAVVIVLVGPLFSSGTAD